jgi:hypothetical protein
MDKRMLEARHDGNGPQVCAFTEGGYYLMRGAGTQGFIRCAAYRHRPYQADMLHLDVWYYGQNVLIDAGTYSYNTPPWTDDFISTAWHNTVTVDGRDQMRKGSRFLWRNWTQARALRCEVHGDTALFIGEHPAYRPVTHRRYVLLRESVYLVLDELLGGAEEHTFRLHWLVNDFALQTDAGGARIALPSASGEDAALRLRVFASESVQTSWARADETARRGWQSVHYGERLPAWSFEAIAVGREARFLTCIGLEEQVASLSLQNFAEAEALARSWLAECEARLIGSDDERPALPGAR